MEGKKPRRGKGNEKEMLPNLSLKAANLHVFSNVMVWNIINIHHGIYLQLHEHINF